MFLFCVAIIAIIPVYETCYGHPIYSQATIEGNP